MINEVFKFMENQVRIIGTSEDPLFCLKDVCDILELRVDKVVERLTSDNNREADDPLSKGVVSKQAFVDSKGRHICYPINHNIIQVYIMSVINT